MLVFTSNSCLDRDDREKEEQDKNLHGVSLQGCLVLDCELLVRAFAKVGESVRKTTYDVKDANNICFVSLALINGSRSRQTKQDCIVEACSIGM